MKGKKKNTKNTKNSQKTRKLNKDVQDEKQQKITQFFSSKSNTTTNLNVAPPTALITILNSHSALLSTLNTQNAHNNPLVMATTDNHDTKNNASQLFIIPNTISENDDFDGIIDDEEQTRKPTWKRLKKHEVRREIATQLPINSSSKALSDTVLEESVMQTLPLESYSNEENFEDDLSPSTITTMLSEPNDNTSDEDDVEALLFLHNYVSSDDEAASKIADYFDPFDEEDNTVFENNNNIIQQKSKKSKEAVQLNKQQNTKQTTMPVAQLKGIDYFSNNKHLPPKEDIEPKDDSDNEEIPQEHLQEYGIKFPHFPADCIDIGILIKFLANVYLRKIDKTANIFLPRYTMEFTGASIKTQTDYFRTPKGEICVFASGGLQNVWEKTVSHVFRAFNNNEKIKIIRAGWIQKHLYKDKSIKWDIEEEYKGRENQLHSEFYFDIFFRHFFLPVDPKLNSLTINAYSWWDICNNCEERLTNHEKLLPSNISLYYQIVASRRYQHNYPSQSLITSARALEKSENDAWKRIWACVMSYVHKKFKNEKEKEFFWTKTKEGLEICKWLGQAFVENQITTKVRRAKILKKGDVLKYYAKVNDQELQELEELFSYLREKNWDLSCWYKPPRYPEKVQSKWKKHWQQFVMPHFDWEIVYEDKCDNDASCEMCGYPDIQNVFLVFHPKFRASASFFKLPTQAQQAHVSSKERRLPATDLSHPLQQKRKQSLCVGSECVETLSLPKEALEKWRKNYTKEHDLKWEELDRREADLEALDKAERELAKKARAHSCKR